MVWRDKFCSKRDLYEELSMYAKEEGCQGVYATP